MPISPTIDVGTSEDACGRTALLISGGIESALLVATPRERRGRTRPMDVRCGLRREDVELGAARSTLPSIAREGLAPLVVPDEPIWDVYGPHWSTDGADVEDASSAEEAIDLPGRNLLLIMKAALRCRLRDIPPLALVTLGSNPSPDATEPFLGDLERVPSRALSGAPKLREPFAGLHKSDVMRRGSGLTRELTCSCIRPVGGLHCGRRNKCAERRQSFREASVADRTRHAR